MNRKDCSKGHLRSFLSHQFYTGFHPARPETAPVSGERVFGFCNDPALTKILPPVKYLLREKNIKKYTCHIIKFLASLIFHFIVVLYVHVSYPGETEGSRLYAVEVHVFLFNTHVFRYSSTLYCKSLS